MITVISGTNRQQSECMKFARIYQEMLSAHTPDTVKLLALEQISHDWFHHLMYAEPSESLIRLQDEYILPADKFVFFMPEYNGGVPGALKLFIDACTVREYASNFKGKKAALVGVASGRAGNLRGMEHLTGVLNYLGTIVMPDKLPISQIGRLKDGQGEIVDTLTLDTMKSHAHAFLKF